MIDIQAPIDPLFPMLCAQSQLVCMLYLSHRVLLHQDFVYQTMYYNDLRHEYIKQN